MGGRLGASRGRDKAIARITAARKAVGPNEIKRGNLRKPKPKPREANMPTQGPARGPRDPPKMLALDPESAIDAYDGCLVVVFLHVEKTAGTSTRFFLEQQSMGKPLLCYNELSLGEIVHFLDMMETAANDGKMICYRPHFSC